MPAILPDQHGRLCLVTQRPDGTWAFEHRNDHIGSNSIRPLPAVYTRVFDRYVNASSTCTVWRFDRFAFDLTSRVVVIGILNVTPDSFYDGGLHAGAEDAVSAGLAMADEGADIIDVGGESTRPGAGPVPVEEQMRRVLPVVERLTARGILVSVDTRHPAVAREAIRAGARIVNDIAGFVNPEMVDALAETAAGAFIMHMRGSPATMQRDPQYAWVTGEVAGFLGQALDRLTDAGVDAERTVVDPGIGFGKTLEHNVELLRSVGSLLCLGRPVLVGVSRKSFIGKILDLPADLRLEGSLAAGCAAVLRGARLLRVHDVPETVRAMRVLEGLL
ncbi:dihydropteroate synthase [Candidatus Fermentibacteria bacterium]|nr:dihydropteroate synthase [Candidatus Fermentibacteria bacterium]